MARNGRKRWDDGSDDDMKAFHIERKYRRPRSPSQHSLERMRRSIGDDRRGRSL